MNYKILVIAGLFVSSYSWSMDRLQPMVEQVEQKKVQFAPQVEIQGGPESAPVLSNAPLKTKGMTENRKAKEKGLRRQPESAPGYQYRVRPEDVAQENIVAEKPLPRSLAQVTQNGEQIKARIVEQQNRIVNRKMDDLAGYISTIEQIDIGPRSSSLQYSISSITPRDIRKVLGTTNSAVINEESLLALKNQIQELYKNPETEAFAQALQWKYPLLDKELSAAQALRQRAFEQEQLLYHKINSIAQQYQALESIHEWSEEKPVAREEKSMRPEEEPVTLSAAEIDTLANTVIANTNAQVGAINAEMEEKSLQIQLAQQRKTSVSQKTITMLEKNLSRAHILTDQAKKQLVQLTENAGQALRKSSEMFTKITADELLLATLLAIPILGTIFLIVLWPESRTDKTRNKRDMAVFISRLVGAGITLYQMTYAQVEQAYDLMLKFGYSLKTVTNAQLVQIVTAIQPLAVKVVTIEK